MTETQQYIFRVGREPALEDEQDGASSCWRELPLVDENDGDGDPCGREWERQHCRSKEGSQGHCRALEVKHMEDENDDQAKGSSAVLQPQPLQLDHLKSC